jgi:choline dehydrogenase-like flavoprotein
MDDCPESSGHLNAAQVLRGPLPEVVSMAPVLQGAPFAHEKTVFDGAGHAAGSCRMGVDSLSVVDSNAATVMIAEKAADLLR